jgi:O-antigen ligase
VTFRSIQLWTTVFVLVLSPLFFGSVDRLWVALWAISLSIATSLGIFAPLTTAQARILVAFLSVCGVYAVVAAVQIAPHLLTSFDDPIWRRASELMGIALPPRISGTAQISPVVIGHFLLFVTSFLSGFCAGTSRSNASTLVFAARIAILVYAIYGLVSLAVAPDFLLWAPKLAYRGSLTASFVNHNTAATFVGCGVILWSCRVYFSLQSLQKSSLRVLLLSPFNQHIALELLLRASAAITCVFALLLTNSRGGLICTSLGLFVALGSLVARKFNYRIGVVLGGGVLGLIILAGWLARMGRIGSEGVIDDGRWFVYSSAVEAIRQRPWFGSGAGTFESLFPSLRTADFDNWGLWDYAHSTVLELAIEMGLPVVAMIVIAGSASVFLLMQRTLNSDDRTRATLAAISGIAVLTYLHSMIDFSLQIPGYLITFGILLGCGLAMAAADDVSARRPRAFVEPGRLTSNQR